MNWEKNTDTFHITYQRFFRHRYIERLNCWDVSLFHSIFIFPLLRDNGMPQQSHSQLVKRFNHRLYNMIVDIACFSESKIMKTLQHWIVLKPVILVISHCYHWFAVHAKSLIKCNSSIQFDWILSSKIAKKFSTLSCSFWGLLFFLSRAFTHCYCLTRCCSHNSSLDQTFGSLSDFTTAYLQRYLQQGFEANISHWMGRG